MRRRLQIGIQLTTLPLATVVGLAAAVLGATLGVMTPEVAAIAVVVPGFAAAILGSHRLARRLRTLAQAVEDVAAALPEEEPPAPGARPLERPEAARVTPEPFTLPVPSDGRDDLSRIAAAFEAIVARSGQVAADGAERNRLVELLVTFGRRSLGLVDRQLEMIDHLEEAERDPGVLADLYRLDHLGACMRRNVENLLVLAGEETPRRWGGVVPLIDVLRAAMGEATDLDRIDIVSVEPVGILGHLAADLSHLLAELLENATAFSEPSTRVKVHVTFERTTSAASRCTIEIVDSGLGMSDAELEQANRRLAGNTEIDGSGTRRVGFLVVAHLAARTGVAVRLRRADAGGVVAVVALASAVLTPLEEERTELPTRLPLRVVHEHSAPEIADMGAPEADHHDETDVDVPVAGDGEVLPLPIRVPGRVATRASLLDRINERLAEQRASDTEHEAAADASASDASASIGSAFLVGARQRDGRAEPDADQQR